MAPHFTCCELGSREGVGWSGGLPDLCCSSSRGVPGSFTIFYLLHILPETFSQKDLFRLRPQEKSELLASQAQLMPPPEILRV